MSCSDNVIEDIQNKLQDIRNPMAAMMVLLRELDLETDSEVGGEGPMAPGMFCCYLYVKTPPHCLCDHFLSGCVLQVRV